MSPARVCVVLLVSSAAIFAPATALADKTVAGGVTFIRLGGRRATGSRATPQVAVELPLRRLGPRVELTYRNSLWLFGFGDAVRWLGAVDQNALSLRLSVDRFRVSPGLALELLTVPLCTDLGYCGRSTGVAPAGVIALSAAHEKAAGWGGMVSATVRYLPAEPQPGWSGSGSVVGTYSW